MFYCKAIIIKFSISSCLELFILVNMFSYFKLNTFTVLFRLGRVENVDTSTFRMATWNYIHLVYGIYHDDYLYTEVIFLFCVMLKTLKYCIFL